tara:strand:+ start:1023 stop:1280 length:258 start_codon:yes stop_codon:yes gene_type:complete
MKELGFYITGTPLLPPCGTTMDKLGIILLQRRSYGKTQILFMRERLGIEPSKRLSAVSTVLKTAAGTSHAIIPNIGVWLVVTYEK